MGLIHFEKKINILFFKLLVHKLFRDCIFSQCLEIMHRPTLNDNGNNGDIKLPDLSTDEENHTQHLSCISQLNRPGK